MDSSSILTVVIQEESLTNGEPKLAVESKGPLSRRLELPLFAGEDVEGWIFKAERYFKMGVFSEAEKLEAVVLCFEVMP